MHQLRPRVHGVDVGRVDKLVTSGPLISRGGKATVERAPSVAASKRALGLRFGFWIRSLEVGGLGKRLASTFDIAAAVDDARRTCVDELQNLLSTTGFDEVSGARDISLPLLGIGTQAADKRCASQLRVGVEDCLA